MAKAFNPMVSGEALISALTHAHTLFEYTLELVGPLSGPAGRRVSSAQRGHVLTQMHTIQLEYKRAEEFYWRQLPNGKWHESWEGTVERSPAVDDAAVKPFVGASEGMQATKKLREALHDYLTDMLKPGMEGHARRLDGTAQDMELRHACRYTSGASPRLVEFVGMWNRPSNWMKCPDLGSRKSATGTRVDTKDGSHSEQTSTRAGSAQNMSRGKGKGLYPYKVGYGFPGQTESGGSSVATERRHRALGPARPPTKPTGTDYRKDVSTNINSGRDQGQGRFVAGATGGHARGISKGVQIPAARPQTPSPSGVGRQGTGAARPAIPPLAPGPRPLDPRFASRLADKWKAQVANSKRGKQGTPLSKSQTKHVMNELASLGELSLSRSPVVAGRLASGNRSTVAGRPVPGTRPTPMPLTRHPHPVPVRVR